MNLKQIIEKNNEKTILKLYGREFALTSEKKIYSEIYCKYKKLALDVSKEFKKEYTDRYDTTKDIEKVRNDVMDRFIICIQPLINEIRGDFASIKIYDYTNESIIEELSEIGYFEEFQIIYNYVCSKIEEIDSELEEEKEYREYRKESRDRWEVSTFGGTWGDAIVNQAQAGIVNGISGIGHSIRNSIGNSMSESEARSKKARLYTEKLKEDFVESVYIACINIHLFVIQQLDERNISMSGAIVSGNDKERAAKILENYLSLNTDDETALDMLQDAISINPFSVDIYMELLERFGDVNNELVNYGKYFDVDIKSVKEDLSLKEYEEKIGIIDDEDKLKKKEQEVIQMVKNYGLDYEESEVCKLYNKKLHELDLKFRTVEGIVFEERKEAELARKELSEIKKLMDDIGKPQYLDGSYEERLENTLENLNKYTTSVKDKYENKVKDLIKEYDLNYRKVDDITFDTREEADLARQEKTEIKKIMPNLTDRINKIDEEYEAKLIEARKSVSEFKTDIKKSYISELDKKLKEYDVFYRTVEYYIMNIEVFDTREKADKARKEVEFLESVTRKIKAPTKESLFDYKEAVEVAIKKIKENTTTIVNGPYLQKLNSYLEEFDKLYLKTGAIFKSKSVEDASKKKFKDKFNFSSMDLSSYQKIDLVWKQVDEFIVKINMTRKQLFMELNPLYTAEMKLNTVDGCVLESREEAAKAKDELTKINKIMGEINFCESIDLAYEVAVRNSLEQISVFETIVKNKYVNKLTDELTNFDVRYRTVDGNVFTNREDAEKARQEFYSITKLLEGINPPDKTSMLDYEENVKQKLQILKSEYSTVIVGKYIAKLQKYLTDFDVLFRKVSLFGDTSREDAAQKRLKTEMSHIKYNSWEDVDNAKLLLDELTGKLGIDRSLVPEYDKMIENNEIRLKTIDGHYFETREEADEARQEYFSIQELLSDVKPPKKTDLLDYEWKIKEKLERVSSDYNTIIKSKYIDLLNKYLADFDDTFCQLSMFKKGTRIEAAKAKALKYVKDAKLSSTIDVENTRKQLIDLLPNLGLQREDIVEAEQYLDQKRNEIVNGVPSSGGFGKFGKIFKK